MDLEEAAGGAGKFRCGKLCERASACEGGGRDGGADFASEKERYDAGRERAAVAVRVRKLWDVRSGDFQFEPVEFAGSPDDICDCSYSRRRRVGEAVA